jgi:hypothetical protein
MTSIAAHTSTLVFHALPADDLHRIRAAGVDDFGHDLRLVIADTEPGTPLRCCLREAHVGEQVALIAWAPLVEAPDSAYAEVGPVFVHADDCAGHVDEHAYPEGFRHRRQVLRSYTASGDMQAATITDGATAEIAITELLADPAAVVVHSRNVAAGCYMFAIRRG